MGSSDAVLQQRTYFLPVLAAYVLGLWVAFGANSVTGLGQPALLYLCPLTLGSVAAVAASRCVLYRAALRAVPCPGLPGLRWPGLRSACLGWARLGSAWPAWAGLPAADLAPPAG